MSEHSQKSVPIERKVIFKLMLGIFLLLFGLCHGLAGLLANVGWYEWIGEDFDSRYLNPVYQSACWFANGIGLTILFPMWLKVIRRKTINSPSPS